MFEAEQFIVECRAALEESDAQGAINEIVKKAVSEPGQIIRALGEPQLAGVDTVYRAPDLTILNIRWGPHMDLHPHDHRMWAVIGIYGGREDNIFYRRSEDCLTQHGLKQLDTKDTVPLGETIIHSVSNPSIRSPALFTSTVEISSKHLAASGTRKHSRSIHTM